MAEGFAAHRFTSREAGQLYAAWRNASPAIRQRILDQPQLFLKAQRQREPEPPSTAIAELSRDLGMVVAISHRANRRLAGATVELDHDQCATTATAGGSCPSRTRPSGRQDPTRAGDSLC